MIHHVYANRSNAGDWLSALGIQKLLEPLEVTEHLCDEPFIPATLARLRELGEDDLVVIGGGGLFMDYFRTFWEGIADLSPGLRYCIWGVGYCDLKREPSRSPDDLLRRVVEQSEFSVVRGAMTRDYLAHPRVLGPIPCPSVAAVEAAAGRGWGVLHVNNYTTAGADVYEAMRSAAMAFAESTGRPFWEVNNRLEPDDREHLDSILSDYAHADVIVSSALHGCVMGLARDRRVLAVSGDRKIESFMEAVGLSDWVLDISDVDRVAEGIARLHTQPSVSVSIARARAQNEIVARRVKALVEIASENVFG